MATLIPGFEWQPIAGAGVSWRSDYRRKIIVLHRTQGPHVRLSRTTSPVGAYLTGPSGARKHCPHGTLSPKFGQAWQHIGIEVGCNWTIKDAAGGVDTYDSRWTINFEMTGDTDSGPGDMTAAEWAWVGEKLAQCAKAMGGSRIVYVDDVFANCKWVNASDGFVARPDAPQRMTFQQWQHAFESDPSTVLLVGHCHIPENDHYDPGRLDKASMNVGMARVFGGAPPERQDENMAYYVKDGTTEWLVDGGQQTRRQLVPTDTVGNDFAESLCALSGAVINIPSGTATQQATWRQWLNRIPVLDATADDAAMVAIKATADAANANAAAALVQATQANTGVKELLARPPSGGGGDGVSEARVRDLMADASEAAASSFRNSTP